MSLDDGLANSKKAAHQELNGILKAERMPIGTKHKGMEKVAEGKWVPIKEGSGKAPAGDDHQAKHHTDEAGRHMEEAVKHQGLNAMLKEKIAQRRKVDPSFEVPEKAQSLLDESGSKAKAHAEDYKAKKQRV